jgi:ribosomal protein L11 methyltransferase
MSQNNTVDTIEITFRFAGFSQVEKELLPVWLESIGFEGFTEEDNTLVAYIAANRYHRSELDKTLKERFLPAGCYEEKSIADKNWNEYWESSFQPTTIDGRCYIRAPFHKADPSCPYDIIIEPKMSFGTGHHETTSLMVSELLRTDLKRAKVLDAGCGTGILAIISEKLGAEEIVAVDIDPWSYKNAAENILTNQCSHIRLIHGDAGALDEEVFDIILANLNLNILRHVMVRLAALLRRKGILLISGVFKEDAETMTGEAEKHGLAYRGSNVRNQWALLRYEKI